MESKRAGYLGESRLHFQGDISSRGAPNALKSQSHRSVSVGNTPHELGLSGDYQHARAMRVPFSSTCSPTTSIGTLSLHHQTHVNQSPQLTAPIFLLKNLRS